MCYPRCLQLTQRQQRCGNKAMLRAPTQVCARPHARVLLAGRQTALCQNHMPNDWTSTRIEWRGKVTASFRMPLRSQARTLCVQQCIHSTRIASAARRRARPMAAATQSCGLAQTARISSREHIMSHYATDVRRAGSMVKITCRRWAMGSSTLERSLTHSTDVCVLAQLLSRLNAQMLSVCKCQPRDRKSARGSTFALTYRICGRNC